MKQIFKNRIKPLIDVHYLTNIALASSYFLLKNIPHLCEFFFDSCLLEWREVEILMLLVISVAVKTRRASTWLQLVSTICTFSKAANVILYWREGPIQVFFYCLLWFLHFVFLPQPAYKGPEKVQYFRSTNLEHEIKRDERVTWLVCFYAPWSPPCKDFTPVFAEISNKFGGLNNFKFAKFDANLYPDIAKKFNISTSSLSKQLPTLVLFEKGIETKRRPFIDSNGKVFNYVMSYENIVKDFNLNKIFFECKNNPIIVRATNENAKNDNSDKKNS